MMKVLIQFSRIVLVLLLMTFCATQGTFLQTIYSELRPGQNITGKIGAELVVGSNQECATRCFADDRCDGYQYNRTGPESCIIILKNCTDPHRKIFKNEDKVIVYEIVQPEAWNVRNSWTGPSAVLYQNFDNSAGFVLMEGIQQMGCVPVISGKVNLAWTFNGTKNQWVDLGIHTEACMTRPETCGAAGGAISFWVNLVDCDTHLCGIISSHVFYKSGFVLFMASDLRFHLFLQDRLFIKSLSKPTGWTHLIFNYFGPSDEEGLKVYRDGAEETNGQRREDQSPAGDGRIVIGRMFPNKDKNYATMQIDELIFFNQALTPEEILMLNSV